MKYIILLLLSVGVWAAAFPTQAQTADSDRQFAYHYGVLMGHDWEALQLPQDITAASVMVEAMRDVARGTHKISREEAFKAIKNQSVPIIGDDDHYNLSYYHGIVAGAEWQSIGVPIKELTLAAFIEGVESIIRPSNPVVDREVAQLVITKRYQQWHQEKADRKTEKNNAFLAENRKRPGVKTLKNGIQYKILQKGKGPRIGRTEARIKIYQTCTLINGQVVERVQSPDAPMVVTLSGVLAGWKELLPLMRENETIQAYLPPQYGYGAQQHGKVPPNSILIYELTVVEVEE